MPSVDVPCASASARPCTKAVRAAPGSLRHLLANSVADMPATRANCSTRSPPLSTLAAMSIMTFDMAEPPASASMPTLDSEVARPSTSPSVSPT